jgi:hypothetical protein
VNGQLLRGPRRPWRRSREADRIAELEMAVDYLMACALRHDADMTIANARTDLLEVATYGWPPAGGARRPSLTILPGGAR